MMMFDHPPTASVLSFYQGMRMLRLAGTYTAAIDRLRRNTGKGTLRPAPPPQDGGAPAAGQVAVAMAA